MQRLEFRRASIHGHDVAFRTGGPGPALLLVHGMAGSSATWRHVMPALAEHFTVVAPDLPGHGASAKPRGDYSLGNLADSLRDLLIVLGHDRATLIGRSLGGGVAMQFAYQFPERCERRYVYRAVDQHGQIIDVYVSSRRDSVAARRFFDAALSAHGEPVEVVTDRAPALRAAIEELIPGAFHNTE